MLQTGFAQSREHPELSQEFRGMRHVAVIGSGAMGTACAILLADQLPHVTLWGRDAENMRQMAISRENSRQLPGTPLPTNLSPTADSHAAVAEAECLVVAVPTRFLRATLKPFADIIPPGIPAISVVKGIENETFCRPTQVILETTGPRPVVALTGPCHAEEAVHRLPCSLVAASEDSAAARQTQNLFTSDRFRVYTNSDIVGAELAGAIKNVMAIAAGISDGLGYGDNAKSALMTRGIVEMMRFGAAFGAHASTFQGLAGIGDLITTCVSPHGRNRRLGEGLGRGQSLEQASAAMSGVAEGVNTCRSVIGIARERGIDMPIATEVHRVLFEGQSPQEATNRLMQRPLREE